MESPAKIKKRNEIRLSPFSLEKNTHIDENKLMMKKSPFFMNRSGYG